MKDKEEIKRKEWRWEWDPREFPCGKRKKVERKKRTTSSLKSMDSPSSQKKLPCPSMNGDGLLGWNLSGKSWVLF